MTASVASPGHHALSLFSVHAPQDASFHQHLEKHLSPLKRLGLISTHSVDDIPAGADRDGTITQFLRQAQIILLLISSDFIASDSCYSLMMRALQRENDGHIRVIPILLRPIEWEQLPGSQLSALPSNGRPVTNWPTSDDAFDNIARSIRQVVQMLNHTTDERTITQAHLGYLHWLIKRTSFLDTRGISSSQRPLRVKLETASIILNARYENPQTERPFLPPLTLPAEVSVQASAPEPLSRVVSRHDHLVILGEPGSGKTTLLHSLALRHAQALRDHSKTDLGDARFPILLRIADYVQYGMHQNKTVSEYLADDCTRHEYSAPHLDEVMRAELQAGRCLLLFDGLDEVIHADDRQMVVQRLEDFVRSYDEMPNRFLLTSRSAGYHETPLSDVFAHYTLQGLEERDIRHLLEAWYMARTMALAQDGEAASTQLQRARREADDLLNAIQAVPGVRRLASNPLLLRMLAQLHHAGAPLPQQRAELYDQMTKTLTQTWRATQGVSLSGLSEASSKSDDASTTRLLSRLAYWFHNKLSGKSVHEQDICQELSKEWASLTHKPWYAEDPESEMQMMQFLCMVRDHTGIVVEDTPRHYRFAHLTFEEYYAARYLVANSQEQAKRIRTHLHDWRWQEPILLALGLVGMKSREQACLLLETAILAQGEDARTMGFDPSPYESLLGRDYLFALRCLGDEIPIRPALAEQLITRLLQEITQQTGSGIFQKYQEALAEHLHSVEESTSALVLLPHLFKNLESVDLSLRLWSLYSLGRIGRAFLSAKVRQPLLETLHDHDSRIRPRIAQRDASLVASEHKMCLI